MHYTLNMNMKKDIHVHDNHTISARKILRTHNKLLSSVYANCLSQLRQEDIFLKLYHNFPSFERLLNGNLLTGEDPI